MKKWLIAAILVVGLVAPTWAHLLDPTNYTGDASMELEYVRDALETEWPTLDLTGLGLLYKDNTMDEGDSSGITPDSSFDPGVSTSYSVTWSDMDTALYAIVVKAADNMYIYLVSPDQRMGSGGTETVQSYDGRAISHVSFYGVPDGGATVLLLGMALCVGGLVRKRLGR